ncbi:hypothetical protein D5S18_18725 [Nocardia panacis]|uniref:Uncharacterized protein n=1 Tax=Nocardia panacis TaxID=2340916 RepID=A0A3A4K901_9NOCA|nr:hypothetical protein D5S18_18725 [Nocardia panacis]
MRAAADRLLAGTPPRSSTGSLTGSELIVESGLRRDVVYGSHKDLVEEFQARVKAQHDVPEAVAKVNDENRVLREEIITVRAQLADGRRKGKTLAKFIAELSLELEQIREELEQASSITQLSSRREDS